MTSRATGDVGAIGGIEVLPFGFLTFISVTLLIANVWAVVDTRFAVAAAAREASRAYVEHDDPIAAEAAMRARGLETLGALGRGGDRVLIADPVLSGPFGRCARVTITITYQLPALAIPFIGGLGRLEPIAARSTALIDPFRDDVTGPTSCG